MQGNKKQRCDVKQEYKISQKEAFELYRTNETFRDFLNSGLFRYSGFGITTRIQVRSVGEANYLAFSKVMMPIEAQGSSNNVMFHKKQVYEEEIHFRNTPHNAALYDNVLAYEQQFNRIHSRNAENTRTANEMMFQYMQSAGWNTAIFQDKTLLSPMDYTRVQRKDHKFKLPAYVAMAVGLGLTLQDFQNVLQQAGLSLAHGDKKHDAYAFLLTIMNGKSIDVCNDFLEQIGVEMLGTHEREVSWSGNKF
ncbi:MAG: hypothetical protein IJZ23_09665 [Roseburia sp.]|nr:hypothetical protein [Roseburia sp.]